MKRLIFATVVASLLVAASTASATVTLGLSEGDWSNPIAGAPILELDDQVDTYGNLKSDQIWWGTDVGNGQSGLGFTGATPPPDTFDLGDPFEVGKLEHYNNPIAFGTHATAVDLTVALTFNDPAGVSGDFTFTLLINETLNSPGPVDDIISFPTSMSSETIEIDGNVYVLQLLGFGDAPGDLQDEFVSPEGSTNATLLWGRLTQPAIPAPGALLLGAMGTVLVGWLRRRRTV